MHFSRPRLAAFSLLVVDLSEWVMELQEAILLKQLAAPEPHLCMAGFQPSLSILTERREAGACETLICFG